MKSDNELIEQIKKQVEGLNSLIAEAKTDKEIEVRIDFYSAQCTQSNIPVLRMDVRMWKEIGARPNVNKEIGAYPDINVEPLEPDIVIGN